MLIEFLHLIGEWDPLDTWIVVIGALAAMSCTLPGTWLLLRRQSLLGDALSHSILPGIVLSYLVLNVLEIPRESGMRHLVIFLGAAVSAVLSATLTELIQRWGRLDSGAAIGVVFTSMFALGLLLIRMFADKTHVDPDCVLYGSLEQSAWVARTIAIPQSAVVNGAMLAINGTLVIVFFRQLRLSTFDPAFSEAVGLNAKWIQLALMMITAATLVSAFESVGAILVIAMLIVPAATARLLTDRLATMIVLSLVIAASSALLGHIAAMTLPTICFPDVQGASTTGMMGVASGCLFLIAIVGSPRYGVVHGALDRMRLRVRIAGEDILGSLYRHDETQPAEFGSNQPAAFADAAPQTWIAWIAQIRLRQRGLIITEASKMRLTELGRQDARNIVRSHRLWESYMARHFSLPGDHLHATAEKVEHFLSPELQNELAKELDQPEVDPHGKLIPAQPVHPRRTTG